MFSKSLQMPSTKTVISTAASVAASAMLVRSIARQYIPHELRDYIYSQFRTFLNSFSSQITLVIEEFEGLDHNQLFKAADTYLGTIIPPETRRFRVSLAPKATNISVSMERNQEIIDTFNGVSFKWSMVSKRMSSRSSISIPHHYNSPSRTEVRYLELSFHKKHKECALNSYLPHLLSRWKAVMEETKTLKLFTLKNDGIGGSNNWESVILDHPATFDTLAMDMEMKRRIIDDLERFVKRKEFYRRVGKAWKRGYLLFGPPGTGKSSLVAAMANYLKFDIYDLELTNLWNNSQFRRLMISTANRSILVVEDIDRSIELEDRRRRGARAMDPHGYAENQCQVTLSGLLNFADGLWSSCGDERIIVFTTNHKDRLDKALLRPGRMDVHIHMSYCTPCGFRMLASNYHGITQHPLFSEVEGLIEMTTVTPAEVGEQLLKDEEPEIALRGLIEFLQEKKESDEIKAREVALEPLEPSEAEATPEPKGKEVTSKKSLEKNLFGSASMTTYHCRKK